METEVPGWGEGCGARLGLEPLLGWSRCSPLPCLAWLGIYSLSRSILTPGPCAKEAFAAFASEDGFEPPGGCGIRARPYGKGRTWLLILPFAALGLTLGLLPGESLPVWAWARAPYWWVQGLWGWFYPTALQLCREPVFTTWAPGRGPRGLGQAALV